LRGEQLLYTKACTEPVEVTRRAQRGKEA
jgi:hypothetical protein